MITSTFHCKTWEWLPLDVSEHSKKIPDRKLKAAKGAFDASIDCGITFFDTAEVYGAGVRTQRSFMPYHRSSASIQGESNSASKCMPPFRYREQLIQKVY